MNVQDDLNAPFETLLRRLRIGKVKKYIPEGIRLLDLGCGFNGKFLKTIRGHIKFGVGIDKKVRCHSFENIHFISSSFDHLEQIEHSDFDCVTLLAVIEHLDDSETLLLHLSSLLKPGGLIIITTPTPSARPVLEFLSFKLRVISREEIRDHKRYFSKKSLISLLEKCGFEVIIYRYFQLGFNSLCIGKYRGSYKGI
ncbi:MAG: class I SAM-dependent methyltransferase [Syntrophobacterales bacterium CG_4_8_14_3_um_filter_49_14]|nr:MAG: class I SAM-dependent methyltransferase [Syntrophobacterales bacterium CG_4_8_14_3_um_filter_49_14]